MPYVFDSADHDTHSLWYTQECLSESNSIEMSHAFVPISVVVCQMIIHELFMRIYLRMHPHRAPVFSDGPDDKAVNREY